MFSCVNGILPTRYVVRGAYDHVGNVSIRDSYHFTISPIYGKYTQNKNVALFPTVRDVRLCLGLCHDTGR